MTRRQLGGYLLLLAAASGVFGAYSHRNARLFRAGLRVLTDAESPVYASGYDLRQWADGEKWARRVAIGLWVLAAALGVTGIALLLPRDDLPGYDLPGDDLFGDDGPDWDAAQREAEYQQRREEMRMREARLTREADTAARRVRLDEAAEARRAVAAAANGKTDREPEGAPA